MTTSSNDKINIENFTMERYKYIVKYKTAYYSFYLPVILGMLISGQTTEAENVNIANILLNIGECYQIQDDFIDCYGDPYNTGKVGTDIEDGKCSWLIVNALIHCNHIQRQFLIDNYGKSDPQNVKAVVDIYNDLNLKDIYHKEESRLLNCINKEINCYPDNSPLKSVLKIIMSIIAHRES